MRKIYIPIILMVVVIFVVFIYFSRLQKELIVGTAPTLPPFTYIGGEHGSEVVGFDIELAKAIAKERGQNLKIQVFYFQDLIPAVVNGDIDMAISVITIRDDRKERVNFSDPYFSDEVAVLVRKDDDTFEGIDTKEELGAKKRIGTQGNTLTEILAVDIAGDNPVSLVRTWDEAVNELILNRVDAVIINGAGARNYVKKYNSLSILPGIEITSTDYGIIMKKGKNKILNDVNKTLEKLKDSGEYDWLVEAYIN